VAYCHRAQYKIDAAPPLARKAAKVFNQPNHMTISTNRQELKNAKAICKSAFWR
jgi:hypothetical protein